MAEEVKQEKKKVYVETTVVSDATALPTNDLTHDATLEEMWRIKAELSAPNDSWEEYAAALYAYQEEERKQGVKFVSLPPRKPEPAMA